MSTLQQTQPLSSISPQNQNLNPLSKTQRKFERGSSILLNSTASSLIWKEKIKINEKDIEKLKHYNKKELSNINYVLRLPHENYELKKVASMSVEQKLLHNDQNEMNFYKIPNYDKKRAKKRNNTNFRTQHQISDKALLGECKLFQELKLSPYEQIIRKEIKEKDKKNALLLSEIYKKLEDSLDEEDQKLINHFNDRTVKQNDIKLVEGLDNWIKLQKGIQQGKEKRKSEQTKTGPIPPPSEFVRRETIKRMSYTLPQINKDKEDKHTLEMSRFPQLVGLLKNDVTSPFGGGSVRNKMNKLGDNFNAHVNENEDDTTKSKKNSQCNTPKNADVPKSRFFDALHDALKTINDRERDKSNDPNLIYDKDRGLRKTIKNYMKKVPDVQESSSKIKGEEVTKQEFTAEGMKAAIEELFKIDDEEGISSVIDRSRFYEKQAGLIESQLIQKIRDTISLINNKVNTARILRLENYQLLRKVNQLKTLIKQLSDDLSEQQNKASKNPNMTQSFFDNSSSVKKKQDFSNSNSPQPLGSANGNVQFNYNQSTVSAMGGEKQTRQNLIGNLMTNVQKLNELESEIQALKNTQISYEQRMRENDKQIILIEENINQKKKELKSLQKGKKLFLLELLKNGKDARGEGISWIIRSIWNGQEKVFDSYLPDFLDQRAKEYLLQRSHKEDELQNMVSLLNMQLELYKANMMINDHMKDIEGLEIDDDNQESNINPSIIQDSSIVNQNQSISQAGNFLNKGNLIPNLSKIDVKRIKFEQSIKKKQEKSENISDLVKGIEKNQQDIVQRTLNELNTSKQTSNDIIYLQTQKKIKDVVRQARQQQLEQQLMKDREKNDNDNVTLLNANQSIISPADNKSGSNKIVLYENNNVINKYESREEFIKQYELLCKKIEEKNKQIKLMEDEELMRIIREFDYKNYRKRMGVPCSVVLCCLFGCYKADKELIRHGMTRK